MAKRALIILSDGFEDVEGVAVIDVLNRAGVEVTVAGLHETTVQGAYGTTVLAPVLLDDVIQGADSFDAVIFPGGKRNAESLAEDGRIRKLANDFYNSGKLVAAICAAPSHVLAEAAGILKGKRAVGDCGFNDRLAKSGAIVADGRLVEDGNVITADGPGSALAFSLAIARRLAGEEKPRLLGEKWGIDF